MSSLLFVLALKVNHKASTLLRERDGEGIGEDDNVDQDNILP